MVINDAGLIASSLVLMASRLVLRRSAIRADHS